MADTPTVHLCILWEDELRKAARFIQAANDLPEGDPKLAAAQQDAWAACSVALYGLTEDKEVVMLGHGAIRRKAVTK